VRNICMSTKKIGSKRGRNNKIHLIKERGGPSRSERRGEDVRGRSERKSYAVVGVQKIIVIPTESKPMQAVIVVRWSGAKGD